MRIPHALTLVFLSMLVSACSGGQGDSQASAARVAGSARLSFDPVALSSCDTGTLVKVRWDARSTKGVKAVNVFTVRPDGTEALFAGHVRLVGMKRTGHWISAGREFIVRDANSGTQLARASVGTQPCAPASEVEAAPQAT
jgi:hypothetical protein